MAKISYRGRVAKVPQPSGEPMLPVYKEAVNTEESAYKDDINNEHLEKLKKYEILIEELETRIKKTG